MRNNLRIALAHDHLFQVGGAEHVLRELLEMYPHAPLYTLVRSYGKFDFLFGRTVHTSYLQLLSGGTGMFKFYLSLMPRAWEKFDFSTYNVVISSSSAFVKGLVTSPNTIHISYCHSPTRYLWSDTEQYVNTLTIPPLARHYVMQLLKRLQPMDKIAASRVNYFIANSNFIASRIKKYYNRDSTVIYPPVNTKKFHTSSDIQDYYLIVSRLRPYKKVNLAVDAFNQLRLPLVVIGGGEELGNLRKKAKKNISFLGEVSDKKRNYYLARCRAFIHPQEEDFGISAVEAMASGRPVIAYKAGGAEETVKNKSTGIFFDEQSWEALAYAILTFDHREFDPVKIQRHAKQFDVSVFHTKFNKFVNDVLKKHELSY